MPQVTYKNLYTLVDDLIKQRTVFNNTNPYSTHQTRSASLMPLAMGSRATDVSATELVQAVQSILMEAIPSRIIEGLEVTAFNPPNNQVYITAGSGSANGSIYTLVDDITMTVPFDNSSSVFYLCLYRDTITFEKSPATDKVTVAKIVVPLPGVTSQVVDNRGDSLDAYIIQYNEYKLYGNKYGVFEEETVDLLRDNIGPILADNLIGNIRLSENLKVTNTAGTIELDSLSMKIFDENSNMLAKFNRSGVFLYNNTGVELAKFTGTEARIGNIKILTNALQSDNYVAGSIGFKIQDTGNVEFNNMEIRGTIYATAGQIGGWTIASNMLYGTTTGIIKTSYAAGLGANGVVLDIDGLRVYDDVLGLVVNLPSNGSAPTFSSGTITSVTFEINTNSVLRTSATVGDGTANSYGILINNTGLYGCGASQTLANANLKVLATGNASFNGQIVANQGQIGGVTITATELTGGIIVGAVVRGGIFETSASMPKLRIDETGMYYQITSNIGTYGTSASPGTGMKYGDGTHYGIGIRAMFASPNYPPVSVLTEDSLADVRLYNRLNDPVTGIHELGDLICVDGILHYCYSAGEPGTFLHVNAILENRTNDTGCTQEGRIWIRTDL